MSKILYLLKATIKYNKNYNFYVVSFTILYGNFRRIEKKKSKGMDYGISPFVNVLTVHSYIDGIRK